MAYSNVAVVIPWRGGCAHRDRALGWLIRRFAVSHPTWRIQIGFQGDDGPWCKGRAVADGVAASTAEIVVISDADAWCDDTALAVEQVERGAPWAIPHGHVHRLTEDATRWIRNGTPVTAATLEEKPYIGFAGGGIVVLPRSTYIDVPIDPRFEGWGQEDASWALALTRLAGRAWRGSAPLWHLWHPPQPRRDRAIGSDANEELWLRYRRAKPAHVMRELVDEAQEATWLTPASS